MLNVKWECQLEAFTEVGKPLRLGLGRKHLGAGMEAEKRTQSFVEAGGEAQGVEGGGSRAVRRIAGKSSPEEVGCAVWRSCLEILASAPVLVSSTVSVQAAHRNQSWVALEIMFLSHGFGGWESPVRVLKDSA